MFSKSPTISIITVYNMVVKKIATGLLAFVTGVNLKYYLFIMLSCNHHTLASNSRPKYHVFASPVSVLWASHLAVPKPVSATRRRGGGEAACWKEFERVIGGDTKKPGTRLFGLVTNSF